MKVVILAGGYGTRISEETSVVPKPLVEIGGRPMIWHIMKMYSAYGLQEFVICCGYKGHLIKDYFVNFASHNSDFTLDLRTNVMELHRPATEPWRVTLVDTGLDTMTGGRVKRIREHLGESTFCLTYGDGVSDVEIDELIRFHQTEGAVATVTAVQQPGRFGVLSVSAGEARANAFREKSGEDGGLINGGFFVLEPSAIDLIEGDRTVWEDEPMQRLVDQHQLAVYRHAGFWHPMDTLRDKHNLQSLWDSGRAPWRVWDRPDGEPSESSDAQAVGRSTKLRAVAGL